MTNKQLFEAVEALGYEVEITHHRRLVPVTKFGQTTVSTDPRGGSTQVDIVDKDGQVMASGTARCSDQDNYSRKVGVSIALGRAYADLTGESGDRQDRMHVMISTDPDRAMQIYGEDVVHRTKRALQLV